MSMTGRSAPVAALVALLVAAACTGPGAPGRAGSGPPSRSGPPPASPTGSPLPPPSPSPIRPGPAPGGPPVVVAVVTEVGEGPGADPYLQGMEQAVREVNAGGGIEGRPLELVVHDHGGDPPTAVRVLRGVLRQGPAAVVLAAPAPVLAVARPQVERRKVPVVVLEGDPYTARGLFRQAFQATLPWVWQAHVLAHYLVTDRKAGPVGFVGAGPEAPLALDTLRSEMAYWGGRVGPAVVAPGAASPGPRRLRRAGRAGWVVVFGTPRDSAALLDRVLALAPRRPGVAGSSSLLEAVPGLVRPGGGTTVAPQAYTWAGWAEPIRRVASFRARFLRAFGHPPSGRDQEGYEAIRVLARGLRATAGRGGEALVEALEGLPPRAFSGLPVSFGPDDHLFPSRDQLGLFAVAAPGERLDPWMVRGRDVWRAVMRTFTSDGERTNLLDADRRALFPFWRRHRPAPEYWRARYGIVSGPSDPRH